MHNEKTLKPLCNATFLSLKNNGLKSIVPFCLYNILFPLLMISAYFNNVDEQSLELRMLQMSQIILPFFSVWNMFFIAREYTESLGNELLYISKKIKDTSIYFLVFFIALLNVLVIMIICSLVMPTFILESARIISACIFFYGLTFFILGLFKSSAIAMLSSLIYLVLNYFAKANGSAVPFFYMSNYTLEIEELLTICLPLIFCGIILYCFGKYIRKRNMMFN